jgi:hypothetical protein
MISAASIDLMRSMSSSLQLWSTSLRDFQIDVSLITLITTMMLFSMREPPCPAASWRRRANAMGQRSPDPRRRVTLLV